MHEAVMRKLQAQGPLHAWLSEEEYLYLKQRFQRLWVRTTPRRWDDDDRLIALGFLRGYTLHREIPEQEKAFWKSLFAEIGIAQTHPNNDQFDELWKAFERNPETRPHLVVMNNRRMLVQTIHRIWGVKGLRADHLERLLKRFIDARNKGHECEIEAWISGDPELSSLKHHAPTYGRIFEGIYLVLNAVRESPDLAQAYLEEGDLESFVAALSAKGLYFEKPHPLIYLRNKSDRLLRALLAPIASNGHHATKRRNGVDVRFLSVKGLSELQGVEVLPSLSGDHFFTNRRVVGEVRLASGVRRRFFWKPRLDVRGKPEWVSPEGGEVTLCFGEDEVRLRFELKPKSVIGLSLSGVGEVLHWHNRPALKPMLYGGDAQRLRYRFKGETEAKDQLDALWPRSRDLLFFEYLVYRDELVPLGELSVWNPPRLEAWTVKRTPGRVSVQVEATLPADGTLRVALITAKGKTEEVLQAKPEGTYSITFPLKPFEPAQVVLQLEPGGPKEEKSVPLQLDWREASRRGVGVGCFPVGRTPGNRKQRL